MGCCGWPERFRCSREIDLAGEEKAITQRSSCLEKVSMHPAVSTSTGDVDGDSASVQRAKLLLRAEQLSDVEGI